MTMANGNKYKKGVTNQQKQLDADTNFGKKADIAYKYLQQTKKSNH